MNQVIMCSVQSLKAPAPRPQLFSFEHSKQHEVVGGGEVGKLGG